MAMLFGTLCGARDVRAAWPSDASTNVAMCTAANTQIEPVIVTDGMGGAFVAWRDSRSGTESDIYAQHVLASGADDPDWPLNGLPICTAIGFQVNCRIVADGSGGAIIVWQDARSGASDVYAHHVLAAGQLDPAWPGNGLPVCTAPNTQAGPEVVTDGQHGAIVTWYDMRNGVDFDVYAQHVRATGSVDPSWPSNGVALCASSGSQTSPKTATDGSGGAIVVWQDARGGTDTDVYAQHVTAVGAADPTWPANGSPVCTVAGAQQAPAIVDDGNGGALVAWRDLRGGVDQDVFAEHVLANGSLDPGWPATGRALCTAPGDQASLAMLASDAGEAIVTWVDKRSGASNHIYAMRTSGPDGSGWPVDGREVSSAAPDQSSPRICDDGAHGGIITWHDTRGGTGTDIYAQHVLVSGAIDAAWPGGGQALCTAQRSQQSPQPLADGSGGAIVAWQDGRANDGFFDIFAQRVQANGSLGGTVVGVWNGKAAGLALAAVIPNPWRGGPLRVEFNLPESSSATLELVDIMGRRIAHREIVAAAAGQYAAELQAEHRCPPGVYLVRLRQKGATQAVRVVLLGR